MFGLVEFAFTAIAMSGVIALDMLGQSHSRKEALQRNFTARAFLFRLLLAPR